jgi:hypothetical protein
VFRSARHIISAWHLASPRHLTVGHRAGEPGHATIIDPAGKLEGGLKAAHVAAGGMQPWPAIPDDGVGITQENLAKVFNHGFTTKKKGHGFGLHNCANAAQQMDGSLTAYSDGPGTGASFVLRMPLEYADELPQRVGFAEAGGVA